MTSSWSSVSLPHCSLTLPLTCLQLPSTRSQFICNSPRVIDSGSAVSMVQISLNNRGGLFARPHSEVCLSPLRVFDWQFGLAARLDADHRIGGFTPSMNV